MSNPVRGQPDEPISFHGVPCSNVVEGLESAHPFQIDELG